MSGGTPTGWLARLERTGLHALRAMPAALRERLVRTTSPRYTLGSICRIEHDGQVLLVETAYRRGWGYPGGLIDRGELPDVGVRREVSEEVGLEVTLVGEPIVVIDPGGREVNFLYRAALAAGVGPAAAHPASIEISRVCWVKAEEALDTIQASSGRLVRKIHLFDLHTEGGLVFLPAGDR